MLSSADLTSYRKLFPITDRAIYLDHAAVAPCSTLVRDAVSQWMENLASNGLHDGVDWEERVDETRNNIAGLIGAKAHEIAFVRSTSQGIALVAEGIDWNVGDEVLVAPAVEYPANVFPWMHLARRGVQVRKLAAQTGTVTPAEFEQAITAKTRVLTVSSVQFASGELTDLGTLAKLAADRRILFVVDGIQSVGAVPIDVGASNIPALSVDSHKWLLGIMGVGFLRIDSELLPRLTPAIVGWRSTLDPWAFDGTRFELRPDAAKFEEGSLPYPLIAGLNAAVTLIRQVGVERIATHIAGLLGGLESALDPELFIVTPPKESRAGFLFLTPRRAAAETVHRLLGERGFRLSLRRGRLRVAPHFYNTPDELSQLAAELVSLGRVA